MKCPNCNYENINTAKFCAVCGQSLSLAKTSFVQEPRKEISEYKKFNTFFCILMAIYTLMSISWAVITIEDYNFYQSARTNVYSGNPMIGDSVTYLRDMCARYEVSLCYTIGVILSTILLGCMWSKKTKRLFYTYIAVSVIGIVVALLIAVGWERIDLNAAALYPIGVLCLSLLLFNVKKDGQTLCQILR